MRRRVRPAASRQRAVEAVPGDQWELAADRETGQLIEQVSAVEGDGRVGQHVSGGEGERGRAFCRSSQGDGAGAGDLRYRACVSFHRELVQMLTSPSEARPRIS